MENPFPLLVTDPEPCLETTTECGACPEGLVSRFSGLTDFSASFFSIGFFFVLELNVYPTHL